MIVFHKEYNNGGSFLAAAALIELLPGISLIDRSLHPFGFSLLFHSSYPLPAEVEKILEERMRQIVKEERLIESCEMVPSCAREFLQREGSSGRDVEIDRQLVEVLQMGSFADWNEGAISSCSDLHAFKLWPVEEKGDGVYRLLGSCFPTKEECKTFFKLFRDYPKKSYLIQGEWQGFWKVIDGEFVWFALGLQVFDAFIQVIKENLFHGCVELGIPNRAKISKIRKHYQGKVIAESFFVEASRWDDEVGLLDPQATSRKFELRGEGEGREWEEGLISSLQRIGKTLNILGFEHLLLFQGRDRPFLELEKALSLFEKGGGQVMRERGDFPSCLQVVAKDCLGRGWSLFQVQWDRKGFSIRGAFEPLFALALELGTIANMVRDIENQ